MKRWKLITQISVMFTIVTVIISLVFILIFEFSLQKVFTDGNIFQLQNYLSYATGRYFEEDGNQPVREDEYNGHALFKWIKDIETDEVTLQPDGVFYPIDNIEPFENNQAFKDLIYEIATEVEQRKFPFEIKIGNENFTIVGSRINAFEDGGKSVIAFTDNRYIKMVSNDFAQTVRFTVLALIVLGNVSLLLWSRLLVSRITYLQDEISLLVKTNYEKPINIDGRDEISSLAKSVEQMRTEILDHEQTKKEIMQNISHDFKTPISVIKTYGEAIKDGITDASEIDVIINQADLLNHKVVQLLQLNKITYLTNERKPEEIYVKNVIQNIVNKNKYKFDKEFDLDLDNSTYFATPDSLEIAIGNVIDNAMRYAKTRIVIVLLNKKLTIYNDGEHINEEFIKKIFKPYEKGHKGEFGLGMSITQQTLAFYDLTISVKNVRKGVMFVIEPI